MTATPSPSAGAPQDLPELPEKSFLGDDVSYGYDEWDMHTYARAAILADRAARQKAVPSPFAEHSPEFQALVSTIKAAAAENSVPAGFWLAPLESDQAMEEAGFSCLAYGTPMQTDIERAWGRMRDDWISRHPAPPAQQAAPQGVLFDARAAILANHVWHQDYDDHGGYEGSDLESTNLAAVAAIDHAAQQAAAVERDTERLDAERYRFMRACKFIEFWPGQGMTFKAGAGHLDAAVDAARTAQATGKEGA